MGEARGLGKLASSTASGLATAKTAARSHVADSDNRRIQRFSASGAFKQDPRRRLRSPRESVVLCDGNVWGTADTAARCYGSLNGSVRSQRSGSEQVLTNPCCDLDDDVHVVVRYEKSGNEYAQGSPGGSSR